jgi:hypothetical protein
MAAAGLVVAAVLLQHSASVFTGIAASWCGCQLTRPQEEVQGMTLAAGLVLWCLLQQCLESCLAATH